MKNLVLYHANCLDGFGAAYAAWHALGNSAQYVAVNYNEPPPDVTGKNVYVLDFSYKRDILIKMKDDADSLLVIDHHKTAADDLAGLPFVIFDMSKSGCVLAWEYFSKEQEVPKGLLLIQDRDLWKFEFPETRPFCEALFSLVTRSFVVWTEYLHYEYLHYEEDARDLSLRGADLIFVKAKEVESLVRAAHSLTIDGVTGLARNCTEKYSSDLGNRLAEESGTFGATYCYDGAAGVWRYSLRSIGEFDVSALAKQFGGGGHINAAGFSSAELLK